jgi:hypothetical protein
MLRLTEEDIRSAGFVDDTPGPGVLLSLGVTEVCQAGNPLMLISLAEPDDCWIVQYHSYPERHIYLLHLDQAKTHIPFTSGLCPHIASNTSHRLSQSDLSF